MKSKNSLIGISMVVGLWITGSLMGQLQQSGGAGSLVTANAGTNLNTSALALESGGNLATVAGAVTAAKMQGNVAQINGVTPLMGNGASGTGSLRVNIASDNTPFQVISIPKTGCGTSVFSQALAAIPTSSTAVAASTTCIVAAVFNNTNGTNVTVTFSDNQGVPVPHLLAFILPPGNMIQPLHGLAFTSGLKWSASTTGVTGGIVGFQ